MATLLGCHHSLRVDLLLAVHHRPRVTYELLDTSRHVRDEDEGDHDPLMAHYGLHCGVIK